jgi:DNA-binding SARP family transcriptional activator
VLRVSVLGEKAITDDETGILTTSSRSVALVAFLVAHAGSPQARQRIAGLFWPDSGEAQALTNLRRELHHLRGVLGREPSLIVTSTDLCWCDTATCRVDLRVFGIERDAALAAAAIDDDEGALVHAARAVAEYKGDLLPGVYDDWLLEVRSDLERKCVDMCDLVCATRTRTGDLTGAADAARRRIQLQPLEEAGHRTLMQLQADLGDRAGAVSTYHRCASVLERELGVIPDPETQRAFQRLMSRVRPASVRQPAAKSAVGRSGFAAAALVGRSDELGLLRDLWRTAAAGGPALALVRGGAGVGKTRLVAEIGWRWRRWRTGCGIRLSSRRWRRSKKPGAPRSTGWCRQGGAGNPGPARERWSTPGSATAFSRALRGRCWPPPARCFWSSTTCNGATRRRWNSSRSA